MEGKRDLVVVGPQQLSAHRVAQDHDLITGDLMPARVGAEPYGEVHVLGLVTWGEVHVPALGRDRDVAVSVPEEDALAEPGAGGWFPRWIRLGPRCASQAPSPTTTGGCWESPVRRRSAPDRPIRPPS